MEFAGRLRTSEACNYLAVPGLSGSDLDEDEGDLIFSFRPKSSPIPSRRSSTSDEDSDPEPPLCSSRRVSFADAKGLSLVQVKEFDTWDVPKLPGYDSADGEGKDSEEYHLTPLTFSLPLSSKEVLNKVLSQKVELETIGLLPETTILRGVIRVLNISYNKSVYIRTSLDRWATHFDLLAEYVPGSSDGLTDSFSFKLTLVPPFGDQGVRVDFCLRYETPVGTFWANNNNRNYVLSCQRRMKEGLERSQRENTNKKSCLKTVSPSVSTVENVSSKPGSSWENMSTDDSDRALEVGTLNGKTISEGQSATSNREGQSLLMENKQNSSRRRQRQAARMARLRDYYAQREAGVDDTGKDETPPETQQATLKETPGENAAGMQPFIEEKIKTECPRVVFKPLEACSTPLYNAAHEHTKQVKSDLDELVRSESASDISSNPPHSASEAASAERQNVSEFVTTEQDEDMSLACTNNSAAVSNEVLISRTDSFTFGTVVAPLYSQAFQRASAKNPINTEDFSLPSESRQTSGISPISARSSMGRVQGDPTISEGSNEEFLAVKEASLTSDEKMAVNKVSKCVDTVQYSVYMEKKPDQSDTNTSQGQQCLLIDNAPTEGVHTHTEAQEEFLAYEAAKPRECKSLLQNPSPILVNAADTLAKDDTKGGLKPSQTKLGHAVETVDQPVNRVQEKNYECTEVNEGNESRETDISLMEDKHLQVFEELKFNQTDSKVCPSSLVYLCEPQRTNPLATQQEGNMKNNDVFYTEEGNENKTGDIKLMYEVAQSIINEVRSNNHCNADMSGRPRNQNVLEKTGQYGNNSSYFKQDDFLVIDIVERKNWEMMVEEEENSVLSNEEESEPVNSKKETNETKGKVKEMTEIKVDSDVLLESHSCTGKVFKQVKVIKTDTAEITEVDKVDGKEIAELQNEAERTSVEDEHKKMEIDVRKDNLAPLKQESGEQKNKDVNQIILVGEEEEVTDADSDMVVQNREDDTFKVGSGITQTKVKDDLPALVSSEIHYQCIQTDTFLKSDEEGVQSKKDARDDQSTADTKHPIFKEGMCESVDDADSASAESDSDEELQLHMHCLRSPGASAQVLKDKIRYAGFIACKRPSISKGKVLSTSMPSIFEALDEEQLHNSPPETHEDIKTTGEATTNTQGPANQNNWRCQDLFSCTKFSKTLMYVSLMVVFTVVAYHYDFLACFLLYLISVIWLCCQGEREPIKN